MSPGMTRIWVWIWGLALLNASVTGLIRLLWSPSFCHQTKVAAASVPFAWAAGAAAVVGAAVEVDAAADVVETEVGGDALGLEQAAVSVAPNADRPRPRRVRLDS